MKRALVASPTPPARAAAKELRDRYDWVDVADVIETLRTRPGNQHIVITGRKADPLLVEAADLVVEMTRVKHPSDVGPIGQGGIEW